MAYAFVQAKETSVNATGTTTVVNSGAFASSLTSGNGLVAACWYTRAAGSTSITFSGASNPTWTQVALQSFNGTDFMVLYIAPGITGGTTTQLTATFGAAVDFPTLWVGEFSGLQTSTTNTVGVNNIQNTPTTGANAVVTSATGVLATQPGMLFGITFNIAGDSSPAAGTGFTGLTVAWDYGGVSTAGCRPEHKRITATSSTTATWTAGTNQQHTSLGVFWPEAAGGTYTVTADFGTYTLSGQAANTLFTRAAMAAAQGSYSYTGQATGFNWSGGGRILTADAGIYFIVGANALVDTGMNADFGTYTLSGQAVTLTYTPLSAYTLTAVQGSYSYTGQATGLLRSYTMLADYNTYTIGGRSAGLIWSGQPVSTGGGIVKGLNLTKLRLGI